MKFLCRGIEREKFFLLQVLHHKLGDEDGKRGDARHRNETFAEIGEQKSYGKADDGGDEGARRVEDGGHRHDGKHGVRHVIKKRNEKEKTDGN